MLGISAKTTITTTSDKLTFSQLQLFCVFMLTRLSQFSACETLKLLSTSTSPCIFFCFHTTGTIGMPESVPGQPQQQQGDTTTVLGDVNVWVLWMFKYTKIIETHAQCLICIIVHLFFRFHRRCFSVLLPILIYCLLSYISVWIPSIVTHLVYCNLYNILWAWKMVQWMPDK